MLNACARFLLLLVLACIPAAAHEEHDPSAAWYKSQTINDAARQKMGIYSYASCCDAGDHFHSRFRLVDDGSKYGDETYEYWKDGRWFVIPPDIVQHKPTPDGRPVLFVNKNDGRELCFIIDREGI